MTPTERILPLAWPCRRDLLLLVLLGLAARAAYLWAALQSQDITAVAMLAPDSHVYTQLGEYYRTGDTTGERHLLVAGPGYPVLLALLTTAFGISPWPPVLLNVLLGALAPVAAYLLAATLIPERRVARLSGLITALAGTGISMSTSVLTDQPFFTLHAFGLLFSLWGLRTGRVRWFVAAGVIAIVATSIRSVGELWPWVYLCLAAGWIALDSGRRNWRLFAKSLCVPALMMAFTLVWSMHNAERHGIFAYTTNGARAAWAYLCAAAVTDHTPGATIDSVRAAWSVPVVALVDGQWPSERVVYDRIKSQVITVLRDHPGWLLDSFRRIVWENVRTPNFYPEAQLKQWYGYLAEFRIVCNDWIHPLWFGMTVLGWVRLLRARLWHAALVLGITYTFFTLLTGFSFWQGSRLHFPAEMAGAILVAYLFAPRGTGAASLRRQDVEAVAA